MRVLNQGMNPLDAIHQGFVPGLGLGARQMLGSNTKRSEAEKLASGIEYIELTKHQGFQ